MPNTDSKTYIVNDQPTETDALDFTPYVETLADIIQTGNTPLTIGVFGTWGSGKTSLMKMVKNQLPSDFTIAWFDAWKYDKEETLWRAFLLNVLFAVELKSGETEELKTLRTMLYRGLEFEKTGGVTIDLAKLGVKIAEGAVQIGLSFIPPLAILADMVKELQKSGKGNIQSGFEDSIQRERTKIYVEQVRSLEQFQDKFATLIKSYISPKRLVIFVDDLDRCLPEKAIQVLEAIKLFLDVQDCVFVLGIDQDVIARGIEMKYKDFKDKKDSDGQPRFTIEGIKYLEKIIQLPFQIPPVEQTDMGDFVHGLSTEWPHEECPKVFSEGLGNNPRQIKRTVNSFLMLWRLAEKRKGRQKQKKNQKVAFDIKPIRLAKVVAIQAVYPELYNLLKEEPRYLRDLEQYYRSEEIRENDITGDTSPIENTESVKMRFDIPPALSSFIGRGAVTRILTLHDRKTPSANFDNLSPDELRQYFTITLRTETIQISFADSTRLPFEPQMVFVPEGTFLMGSTFDQVQKILKMSGGDKDVEKWLNYEQPQHTVELSEYYIGKYPVTNREYREFIRDAQYTSPQGWDGDQYPLDKGDHPVVNISWEDALSYCKWLSAKTGRNYRLPTEAEWEKAARGNDGQVYPWGNEFDPQKTNTAESKLGSTTPVGKFSPYADSPYNCADMIGNIWEWCYDWFFEDEYKSSTSIMKNPTGPQNGSTRIVRGGSFNNFFIHTRCATRGRYTPNNFYRICGFRIVLTETESANSSSDG